MIFVKSGSPVTCGGIVEVVHGGALVAVLCGTAAHCLVIVEHGLTCLQCDPWFPHVREVWL